LTGAGVEFKSASMPSHQRKTKVVKDLSADEIAREIVDWIKG
jgi:hypothetical protein